MTDQRLVLITGADVSHLHVGDHAPERTVARQRLSTAYNQASYDEAVEKIAKALNTYPHRSDKSYHWHAKAALAALGWTQEETK